ncbi:carbohydrate ABC transporter permease [[Mycoplasma] gypis]|uniref:Carbohydrate ABC transporter permease n=1 Tax=[Mycoplasma] gypis TaxID=92404 RepID=A0ABZ2RMR1_9BACT|nr:carbohydrate ABC transporter permease [[Mycoplasma] gypis]MBN0919034.1 carbohydrate ABC transporter permease [[Mycoplasma] gypis]
MSQTRLRIKHHFQKKSLKSKQQNLTSQVETRNLVAQILSLAFKITILGFFGLIILFPFYFMISQSLVPAASSSDTQTIFYYPHSTTSSKLELDWSNFVNAFQKGYFNAILFTAGTTALSVTCRIFFAMTFGYAFSLRKWRFKNLSWAFFLALLVLPETALLAGQYQVVVRLNFHVGSWKMVALTMPFVASVFSGFMFRNAFEAIPDSVKESSMIDGASELKFFVRIAIPMIKSTLWTVCILTALASWNSFIWPQLILGSKGDGGYTVMNVWLFTTGKNEMNPEDTQIVRSIRMAATILVILPMFVTYFIFRGRIMKAISRQGSGQKG